MSKKKDVDNDLDEYAKQISQDLFKTPIESDFDEKGLASGSEELIDKSDAERFPEELEEYTPEERKPKLIK